MITLQQMVRFQKTFILQDQSTNKTKVLPFEVYCYSEQINLYPLISQSLQNFKHISIRIYDFTINEYVNVQESDSRIMVPVHMLDNKNIVVLIKYRLSNFQTMSLGSHGGNTIQDTKSQTLSKKTQRSKERVILEVIQIVKKWRKLCENKKGVTITLAEAAKMIGLPKKSLDDYYYQLRMGEKYGFDYHSHMMERIGILRSFLKKFKTHRKNDKNQKLPNILKIAEQIDDYENLVKQPGQYCKEYPQSIQQQKQQNNQVNQAKDNERIQKQFYNEFNFGFGREADPFMALNKGQNENRNMNEECQMSNEFEMFF